MVATPLHGWINSNVAFEFLGFDMPALQKQLAASTAQKRFLIAVP
jgi:hypothetical protein